MTPAAPFALTRIRRRISLMKRGARRRRRRAIAWSMLVTNTTALFVLSFAFFAFPCRRPHRDGVRETAYEVMKTAQLFELQHGRLPSSLDELTHEIDGRGRLMERVPKDPFGGPYVLVLRSNAPSGFGILSPGEDGLFFTDDDIQTW